MLFYGVLPLWGARRVRRSWDRFRDAAVTALRAPEVDFATLQAEASSNSGTHRLTGTLEAFEGDDRLWIGNGRVSVAVSLASSPVYFLDDQKEPLATDGEPPRRAEAASLGALPEGTSFLVAGPLLRDRSGQAYFGASSARPLLVLAFEGHQDTVLPRALAQGRSPLELWNSWTPVSLATGFVLCLILAYPSLRDGNDPTVVLWGLALALLPSTFFLPPGILFFYGFARFWSKSRTHKARGDLARWFEGRPGAAAAHRAEARGAQAAAYVSLVTGIAVNLLLLVGILKLWLA